MHRVLLLGAGKIGRMIARLLVDSGDYELLVADSKDGSLGRIAKLSGAATLKLDMHVGGELPLSGFVRQEEIDFSKVLANRFGKRYDSQLATWFSSSTIASDNS